MSRAMQFWVALAAILLYVAPTPIERSYVVVAAGIIGNSFNDWVRQLEIFRFVLVTPSKNAVVVFRICFGISVTCGVLFVPELILVPGKWPKIALILVCTFHRLSVAVPILLHRGQSLKRVENLAWAGGNALGAAVQFFGLLLGSFECRLFLYAISSVFGVVAQIPAVVRIDEGSSTSDLPPPNDNKTTVGLEENTFQPQSRWSFDSEIPRRQVSQWVSDKINSDRVLGRVRNKT
ncbi:hypothetical protein F4823DRAFT_614328 [Ustulina deusta]|nr:hypothetical protein F4823DRAFT_614328 [Ustulina deusta]